MREERKVDGAQQDYRSYLLRLYRVRIGGKSSWRASLHAPQGGAPLHFASLSEMVAFLEQEGQLVNGVAGPGQAEESAAGEEGDMDD
jgi:hypothetical protein